MHRREQAVLGSVCREQAVVGSAVNKRLGSVCPAPALQAGATRRHLMLSLAGDIGGTKTNLAVFSPQTGPRAPLAQATFPSGRYPSLEALVREFLSQVDFSVERATFGVAGPVAEHRRSQPDHRLPK